MENIRYASKVYPQLNDDEFYDLICNMHYQLVYRQPSGTIWLNYMMQQWPQDLVAYQELIYQVKPQLIIETGTGGGGCPLFFCSILKLMDVENYMIVTMDLVSKTLNHPDVQNNPHIIYIQGDSTSPEVVEKVKSYWSPYKATIVFLDSDHATQHVLKEMAAYSSLVSIGSYMVVEDTYFGATLVHPLGPIYAVAEWLKSHPNWIVDERPERWFMTQHPHGWLKRMS